MNKNVRWKVITILAVIGLAVWSFYPPGEKVNLGLDLRGGVHLVLRVQTEQALRVETETTVDRLRDTLSRAGVQYAKLEVTSPTEFVVEGIQNDQAFLSGSGNPANARIHAKIFRDVIVLRQRDPR